MHLGVRCSSVILVLLLAIAGVVTQASAHDIGAMRVRVSRGLEPHAAVSVEVLVDLDHVPSAVRSNFFDHLVAASILTIDGKQHRLTYAGVPSRFEPAPPAGSVWQCAFTLDPSVSGPFDAAIWRCDLDLPEYYLVMAIAGPGQVDFQWLEGRADSREFRVKALVTSDSSSIFGRYVIIGLEHIVPGGLDHVLFVLGLYLMGSTWRQLLAQVTAFTLAHSITLGLSLSSFVAVPSNVVEPLIAVSIVLVAVENMVVRKFSPRRVGLVFGFGLLHGLGFAGALGEVGVPQAHFLPALVGFNLGVELGQLVVLLGAFACVGWWAARRPWYRARVAMPACMVIALVASYWTFERVFESLGQRV